VQLARSGVIDAQYVPPTHSGQEDKVAGVRMERVRSRRRSWMVPLGAANLNSFAGNQVEKQHFQAQGGKDNQLVVITAKLRVGWLP
jgi:hypothetical protein